MEDDEIAHAIFGGVPAFYRPGTTDVNALKEVLVKGAYRKASVGFDVQPGDHVCDLGANIGAFALYCQSRGATAECWEPLPANFALLQKNVPQFKCYQTAISNLQEPEVTFWTSRRERNHYRGTLLPRKGHPQVTVKNTHASALTGRKFNFLKMDIEGGEFGILDADEWLLPQADRLVLEYHTSRDNNLENLARRIGILKQHYQHVHYCPELARLVERGTGTGKTYHDRLIFCFNDPEETTTVERARIGGAAPPNDDQDPDDPVVRGQQAWKRLQEAGRTSWEDWKLVGTALKAGREHAMEVADTKKPSGLRYNEAFSIWLQERDFDRIDKADRGKLLSIMEDLDRIEKWREGLTEGQRAAWNHPSTVWRISRCKTRGIKAVNEKAEAPIPNVKDLPPPAEEKDFEQDDEERNWQRELVHYLKKAIGCIHVPDRWLMLEPPDRGQIAFVQELIDKATALRDCLQRFHDSTPEESANVRKEDEDESRAHQPALEDA